MILRIFDVSSTLLFDIGVDFFAILVLIIIYINDSKSRSNSYSDILFRYTQLALIMLIATDIVMWLINGVPGTIAKIIGYADNMLFYVFLPQHHVEHHHENEAHRESDNAEVRVFAVRRFRYKLFHNNVQHCTRRERKEVGHERHKLLGKQNC